MRVIIAGSRTIVDAGLVAEMVKIAPFLISHVVCGCAKGIDALGHQWAKEHGLDISFYAADWKTFGRQAGPIRNEQMAKNADALILIWTGESPGSRSMLKIAKEFQLPFVSFAVLDADNHDPEYTLYKIRMEQNLYGLAQEDADKPLEVELLVPVARLSPKS